MPKTQTPRNAFAPQADPNSLFNVVPQPGWEQRVVPTPRRRITPLEFFDQLVTGYSYGAGKARVGDLQAIYDLATRPRGVYQDLVNAARDVASNPGAVVNALRASAQNAMSSPYAFGQAAGSFGLPKIGRKPGGIRSELDVYHGTPHTFEPEEGAPLGRFRSEKIGTGEGVQAFGHGLYLAETPSVGSEYRGNLSYREMVKKFRKEMPDNADVDEALEWANSGTAPPDMARVIKALNDDDWLGFDYPSQALNALFREPDAFQLSDELKAAADKMRGNLYKVDLPDAKIEQMLDWDKPLSEQPKAFQDAVAKLPRFQDPYVVSRTTGGQAYRELAGSLGSAKKASDLLRQQGIPGIKYFDAGSRTSKQGTRNFVVFPGEEQNLTILERNGVKNIDKTPRVATWFSGAGTMESALPPHKRVMAVEYDPRINAHANVSHGTSFPARSVTDIDPQELRNANPDLFHASPVCKNFSAAKTMRGATDLDRQSAESVARVIREATPPVVTVENVPQYADTALFKHITDALDSKGYKWDVVIHDAADYGAPQSRKRMLLRAVREGELPPVPPKTGGKDWFGAVSDLLPNAPVSAIPPVERRRLNEMIANGRLDPSKPIITMGGSGFRGTWAASNAGQVAPTLKAANEKPRIIMPDGTVKEVTPRMMARLMGLGDNVAVPDSPTLAKTVLGNGISGDVTRNLIAPLLNRPKP